MPTETWKLRDMADADRDEAWRHLISTTHLPWTLDVPREEPAGALARISRRRLGDIDLVDTVCPPCSGRRTLADLARSPGEYVGVLIVHAGREVVSQGDREVVVADGGLIAWDSVQLASFAVLETSRKQNLLIPRERFQQLMPRPELATFRAVQPGPALELFRAYLRSVSAADLEPSAAAAAGNAALELLGAVLGSVIVPNRSVVRDALRAKVKEYIEVNLGERGLRPDGVALAHGISVRTLYVMFEDEGDTVAGYVRRRRLARAHYDLTRPGSAPTITEIATRWGFADGAHFSRSYLAEYGVTPSHARRGTAHARRSSS